MANILKIGIIFITLYNYLNIHHGSNATQKRDKLYGNPVYMYLNIFVNN